ncbi:DUF5693 family protein [Phascolarctobacterium sp.]|uniref:DUF5693 family protein n=1 Tax=Phascolarctobacterium sp. TaxID=2049039 RepID=UPI0025F741E5|nr:DUF5693 family protein [Phascolarctobacterium sp.]
MKSRYNPVLLAVIVVGLVCALWLNFVRHDVEKQNNTVEMAMEYEGLRKLAALQGLPEEDVLRQFKEAGINSLMIFDTTLERLTKNGELQTATGGELRQAAMLGADNGVFAHIPADALEEHAAYVAAAADASILEDVEQDLCLRYGADRVQVVSENPRIIKVKGSTTPLPDGRYDEPQGLLQAPLGLPVQDLRKVNALGFKIIVRPQNYIEVTDEQIDAIFDRIKEAGVPVAALMPCGTEVVGYPNKMQHLGERMKENNMTLVMLEHYTQLQFAKIDGLLPLAEFNDYKAARSYVIDPTEQKKISVGEALRRWALTDEERNIRVNYIRPFLMPEGGQDIMKTNLKYVRDIKASVEARGYTIGEAGVFATKGEGFAPYFPSKLSFIPVLLAIVAGVVLYLSLLFNLSGSKQLALWAVLSAGGLALLFIGRGLLTRQLLALAAASVFPVLSMSVIFNIWDKNTTDKHSLLSICWKGIWQLALAIALSLVGAAFLSAILTDSRFLLEIDIYRGVKLTFILPVIFTAILFIKRYDLLQVVGKGLQTLWKRLNGLLDTGLTFRHVVVLLVLMFIAYYFVGRSGHTGGVPVPAIELKMRAFLEQLMYARPREKEFMIGHPMFFLAVLAVYRCAPRWWQFVLTCAAVIGQGSLVQTFCHMRTPVVMSFVRALDGYAVGVVFGVAGVLVIGALLPFVLKLRRRYLEQ